MISRTPAPLVPIARLHAVLFPPAHPAELLVEPRHEAVGVEGFPGADVDGVRPIRDGERRTEGVVARREEEEARGFGRGVLGRAPGGGRRHEARRESGQFGGQFGELGGRREERWIVGEVAADLAALARGPAGG